MSIENLKSYDPFADTGVGEGIKSHDARDNIHIRLQQRNGRKTLTTVQGLPEQYDYKAILKAWKKDFSTNGTVIENEEHGLVLQLQGDKRVAVKDFLVKELKIKQTMIKIHGA